MTRGTVLPLSDPIDALRFREERDIAHAADFLQLVGFPISPGRLEDLARRGTFKTSKTGKVTDAQLERLLKKRPQWLSELPKCENHDPGMLTIREGMEIIPGLSALHVRLNLSAGCQYFIGSFGKNGKSEERQRCILLPESWLRVSAGHAVSNAVTGNNDRMFPTSVPGSQTKGPKASKPRRPRTAATPEPSAPIKPSEMVEATPPKELKLTVTDDGRADIVPTMEAVALLQAYSFDVTYNDLYIAGRTTPPKINLVRKDKKRYLYIALSELEGLVDNPPSWLVDHERRFPEVEGYKMTRDVQVAHQVVPSRLYQAVAAGLVTVFNPTQGEAQGKLYYFSDEEVARMLAEDTLCRFLRGERISIPEIEEARRNRPEPTASHHEVPASDALEGAEIVHFEDKAPAPASAPYFDTDLSIVDVLLAVHSARRLTATYERLTDEGLPDEEIVRLIEPLLL